VITKKNRWHCHRLVYLV